MIDTNAAPAPDFAESMRQAEQEAGLPPDAELYGGLFEHPEADDTGRTPSSTRPAEETVEAVAEPETEVPATEASEPEPEPDPLADLNKKVGQLINENADLRRALADQPNPADQMQEWLAAAQAQQQGTYSPDQFEELLDSDPATATMLAHQRNDQFGYARAWQAWNAASPGAPQIWADNQNLRAQLTEFQQTIGQQIAPAREAANRQELEHAMSAVAARHDDYAEVMATITPDSVKNVMLAGLPTQFLEQGLGGDQAEKEKVFETLYRWQKAEVAGQLVQAAQETPGRQKEEARDAKREAFVASASTTTPDEVPETEGQRLDRVWKDSRPSLRDAWENRAPSRIGR